MLNINLLPQDVRARKEREVARVKAAAPRRADIASGQKIGKEKASVNFFARFFRRKKTEAETAPPVAQILQTPGQEVPPPPPDTPPYPLRQPATPVLEVKPQIAAEDNAKKTFADSRLRVPKVKAGRAADGIILPDISSINQRQQKQVVPAPVLKPIPMAAEKKPEPVHEIPRVPPPPVKKAVHQVVIMDQIETKREQSKPETPHPSMVSRLQSAIRHEKPSIVVMPRKEETRPAPLYALVLFGILSVVFSGSLIAGVYFTLNKWVLALEGVNKAYSDRSAAIARSLQGVEGPFAEAKIAIAESNLLYGAYQAVKSDSQDAQTTQKLQSLLQAFIVSPAIVQSGKLITVSGLLQSDKTVDEAVASLKTQTDVSIESILKQDSLNGSVMIQLVSGS